MDFQFQVNNEIKQEYLNTKPTGTADAEAFVLREFDNYEANVGKEVYNLSIDELNEMFATLRNSSKRGAGKNKSILTSYIDFCVTKKIVSHMENRAKYIDINNFVARQALLNKYISKEKMMQYSDRLYNAQDQLLLWLPFIGVRGRTEEGATMEEIINLKIDDVFPDKNRLILRQNDGKNRILDGVDERILDLIKETYEEDIYVENNGELTNNPRIPNPRQIKINKTGESATGEQIDRYVFRTPGKDKYERFSTSLLNSRMRRIQNVTNNRYLNYTVIYFSGMLEMAMDIYKEKGELTKEDYIDICVRYNYGGSDSTKYWFVVKDLFDQYKELLLK